MRIVYWFTASLEVFMFNSQIETANSHFHSACFMKNNTSELFVLFDSIQRNSLGTHKKDHPDKRDK